MANILIATNVVFQFASVYSTLPTAFSAITNAAEAVMTLASGHAIAVGDYVEITSGWDLLNSRVARVKALSTNDATLELIDTSNTDRFPPGAGAGTVREITTWLPIAPVKSMSYQSGTLNFADISSFGDLKLKQVPTTQGADGLTINAWFNPAFAWYRPLFAISETRRPTALRIILADGSRFVDNGYFNVPAAPPLTPNEGIAFDVGFTSVGSALFLPD